MPPLRIRGIFFRSRGVVSRGAGELASPMAETHTVTYRGSPPFASMLAHLLEQEGLEVTWERPEETRGVGDMTQAYVVEMAVAGSLGAIKAAVARSRKHAPRGEVEIEDDD